MNQTEPATAISGGQRSRKALLACPDCGHENPTDGDWVVEQRRDDRPHDVYRCPDCDATVTTRPRFATA
ncbi:hypothetical protein [Halostella litorea]|uniref:hypothetical protein n=1 Tax=Halostella litorea TaxID=2528831 RepID=UPI001092EA4A|nr:hypothetical protein [Halostella litorea]